MYTCRTYGILSGWLFFKCCVREEERKWRTVKDAVAIVQTIITIAEIVILNLVNRSEWQLTEDISAEGVI